jgi:hypothetical protein
MSEPLISDASERAERDRRFQIAGMPLWALIFLVLTAVVSLLASHYRLTAGDDLLELWCDRVGSFGQLLHIQRTSPLGIDPFLYHLLTFAGIRQFGVSPFVLRLPSLAGFMTMQVCLFYFVRRIASERAAVFALAFPAITVAFTYTLQIRPYGVLLGLFGLAMLSWQTAVRREDRRTGALVVLALSIAMAVNTHYYGVLLMLPLCAGEAVRVWQRRRLDVAMLLAMGAGVAGMVFLLPFMKGAAEFRSHYRAGDVAYQSITQTYNFLVLGQGTFSGRTNHLLAIGLGLLIALILWSCIRQERGRRLRLQDAEFAFLLTLAALPVFTFLLGHFVTHAMEPRYALGAILGIAALVSMTLEPLLRKLVVAFVVPLLLFAGITWMGIVRVRAEARAGREVLAESILPQQIRAAMMASPTKMLYTQDIDLFGFLAFHRADSEVFSHVVLVYSPSEEMRWIHSGSDSRTVANLRSFTAYTIVPYESVIEAPGEHLFVVTHGGWNWLDKALASGQLEVTPVGKALGGEVVSVRVLLAGERPRVP